MSAKKKAAKSAANDSSITDAHIDPKRRRLLIGGASAVGGLGTAALAVAMLGSMSPSARAKAAGAPVEADIGKLSPGQLLTVEWRGKPVWIVRRTEDALALLAENTENLRDADSEVEQQPAYAKNTARSIKPEYLVVVGICTHLGCSPTYRPELAPPDLGSNWMGGFYCPCHASRFDMAGRVFTGVPAPTNLVIPPHQYIDKTRLVIGVDQGAVA